jgi:hypothetical protein
MKPIVRSDVHYGAVDTIHLMNVSIALSDGKIEDQKCVTHSDTKSVIPNVIKVV